MNIKGYTERLYSELGEDIPYHMFNSTTYVEVLEPYYALIKSKGTAGWIDRYEADICEIKSNTSTISDKTAVSKARTVYEDYAFIKFVNDKYPNLTHQEYLKVKEEFKNISSDTIIVVDKSLE